MKKFIALLLLLPVTLVLATALGVGIAMQQNMVSKSELKFLTVLGQREGIGAVISVIRTHFYGVDESAAGDSSYGRRLITGRGHAPWVIRGNLDGRPRMLKFALAPNLWAAYDTEQLSLYQVWEGDVLFEGAAYDYRHGPQPASEGAWYHRDTTGARWFIVVDGQEIPAAVKYLGHEYSRGMQTAAMRFALLTDEYRLELTEQPEVIERDGERYFTRQFQRVDQFPAIQAGFYTGNGDRHQTGGVLELTLETATEIATHEGPGLERETQSTELEQGQAIIADSDCLGCHAPSHRVTGPAWSQIAGKFRGMLQQEVIESLTHSVVAGSVGTWGQVPMPAHPGLSEAQASAAVAYILSTDVPATDLNPPLDTTGQPYPATLDYDVLPRLRSLQPLLHAGKPGAGWL